MLVNYDDNHKNAGMFFLGNTWYDVNYFGAVKLQFKIQRLAHERKKIHFGG